MCSRGRGSSNEMGKVTRKQILAVQVLFSQLVYLQSLQKAGRDESPLKKAEVKVIAKYLMALGDGMLKLKGT